MDSCVGCAWHEANVLENGAQQEHKCYEAPGPVQIRAVLGIDEPAPRGCSKRLSEVACVCKAAKDYDHEVDSRMINESICALGVASRTFGVLERYADIKTVADLLQYSKDELQQVPNFGFKSMEDLLRALDNHGISLRNYGAHRCIGRASLIDDLRVSVETRSDLRKAGVKTVEELMQLSRGDLDTIIGWSASEVIERQIEHLRPKCQWDMPPDESFETLRLMEEEGQKGS